MAPTCRAGRAALPPCAACRDLGEDDGDEDPAPKRRRGASPDDGESGDEDGGHKGGKRGREAAQKKASREKLRRERINERFSQLAKVGCGTGRWRCGGWPDLVAPSQRPDPPVTPQLIDPGEVPKTDKLSILGDAIKLINHMRQQVYQLRELNKYLQERATKSESMSMYQRYVAAGAQGLPFGVAGGGSNVVDVGVGMAGAGPSGDRGGADPRRGADAMCVAPGSLLQGRSYLTLLPSLQCEGFDGSGGARGPPSPPGAAIHAPAGE